MTDTLIASKLIAIMGDVPAIPKGQTNEQQHYSFRGIDDLYDALHKIFVKHEVVILPEVVDADYAQQLYGPKQSLITDARLRVKYTFMATDGSTASIVTQGESRDYADKATNQALSAALKYALLQMFLIPLNDVDADAKSPVVELSEAEIEERRVNAVKAQLLDILGDKTAAKAHWEEFSQLDFDEIIERANEIAELQGSGKRD